MRATHLRPMSIALVCMFAALGAATAALSTAAQPSPAATPGILLEELTWQQAERVLKPDAVVVIPLGAAAKEHGPHLRLKNDFVLAEYFKRRVMAREAAVVAPTINYHFYPAFVEYPGIDLASPGHRARRGRRHLPGPGAVRPEAVLCPQYWRLDDSGPETRSGAACRRGHRHALHRHPEGWRKRPRRRCVSRKAARTPTRSRPR